MTCIERAPQWASQNFHSQYGFSDLHEFLGDYKSLSLEQFAILPQPLIGTNGFSERVSIQTNSKYESDYGTLLNISKSFRMPIFDPPQYDWESSHLGNSFPAIASWSITISVEPHSHCPSRLISLYVSLHNRIIESKCKIFL